MVWLYARCVWCNICIYSHLRHSSTPNVTKPPVKSAPPDSSSCLYFTTINSQVTESFFFFLNLHWQFIGLQSSTSSSSSSSHNSRRGEWLQVDVWRRKQQTSELLVIHEQRSQTRLKFILMALRPRSLFIRNKMQSTRKVTAAARVSETRIQLTSSVRGGGLTGNDDVNTAVNTTHNLFLLINTRAEISPKETSWNVQLGENRKKNVYSCFMSVTIDPRHPV